MEKVLIPTIEGDKYKLLLDPYELEEIRIALTKLNSERDRAYRNVRAKKEGETRGRARKLRFTIAPL